MLIITTYLYSLQFATQGTGYFHSRACPVMIFSLTLKDVNTPRNSLTLAEPGPRSSVVVCVKMGVVHGKTSMWRCPGCTRSRSSHLWMCLQPQGMNGLWLLLDDHGFLGFLRFLDSDPSHHWLFPLGKFLGIDWQNYTVSVCLTF